MSTLGSRGALVAKDSKHQPVVVTPVNVVVKTDAGKNTASVPPLFSFQINNPITYIKAWWKKLIGNEGIKMTIQIKPVTAFVLASIFCGAGFGLGKLTIFAPISQYIGVTPSPTPAPSPDPWRDTAFTGKVQFTNSTYYLVTTSAEAITLQVPATINLKPLIGKRIMVVGRYNKTTKVMQVTGTPDMEILPTSPVPIPTTVPTATPKATSTPPPSSASTDNQ